MQLIFSIEFSGKERDYVENKILLDKICLFGFYGISTFVGYLMPNPFLYK